MRDIDLFQQALGLGEPWRVERTTFDPAARRLDIYLGFERGARFECPECGWGDCPAYDTTEKQWRHLNFFQHEAYLHARVPRVECSRCGIKQVRVPWARAESGFTLLFEALVLALVKQMPVNAVAALVGETDKRLWRILDHYVSAARAALDFSDVRRVGVDETASKRGQQYVSLFVDLDRPRRCSARRARTPRSSGLPAGSDGARRAAGADPGPVHGHVGGVPARGGRALPAGGADVRPLPRREALQRRAAGGATRRAGNQAELKKTRWLWVKRREKLTKHQAEHLSQLLKPSAEALQTAKAYQMKLSFMDEFWTLLPSLAEAFLRKWCRWAKRSKLLPMRRLANTLWAHRAGLLRWYFSEISNGILEGINSLLQAAKARARGYRTTRDLLNMAYLLASHLDFALPT